MYKRKSIVILLVLVSWGQSICAQPTVKDTSQTTFTTVLPLVFYTPETSLGIGAGVIHNFYLEDTPNARPSLLRGGGAYTFRDQLLLYLSYQLFLQNNTKEVFGEFGYFNYVYFYYGIGNDTNRDFEEAYQVRFPRIEVNALKQVIPNLRAGFSAKFNAYDIFKIKEGGLLETNQPTGVEGGNTASLGLIFRYDTRDNVNLPLDGWYITLNLERNFRILNSPYNFKRLLLDAVHYQPIGRDQTLALNFYTGTMNGDVPFQELLFLGGDKKARGTIDGRYREEALVLWQAAYRFPIIGRFRGAVFASTGRVAEQYGDLWTGRYHFNYGFGARFLLNKQERVQLRLDVGFGSDNIGYYFTVNDAF